MLNLVFDFLCSWKYVRYFMCNEVYNAGNEISKIKSNHPRQRRTSGLIIKMIIGSHLPLSIVEDEHFRELLII